MPIWIVGGTGESAAIVRAISKVIANYVVTVTTPDARKLYDSKCRVVVGTMDRQSIELFCQKYAIAAIVDASHPFAREISQNAIAISQKLNLPYLRYERATVNTSASTTHFELDSFATLLQGDYLRGQKVLLTVGCKVLPQFQPWQSRATLFARILPRLDSLQKALTSGFRSDRIIAFRPPVDEAMEKALWQQWQISLVVTKASGKSGGEDIKRRVADRLNIPLITIARPTVKYPQQTSEIEKIVQFVRFTAQIK